MPNETNSPEAPSQPDSPDTTSKETNLDRLANEAARRAIKREQGYDREHNIFTI
jgi:hypothetical protein